MIPSPDTPDIAVRGFIPADAEGIVALIRRNYGGTYHKTSFYDPASIRAANETGASVSIVALYFETVVGHFAMFPAPDSPIAEIGTAVVDPAFKHLGVMNMMFDILVQMARERSFGALYGEAIMLHPFSQRANLRHGMVESAILLGEVPSSIEIAHRYKNAARSGGVDAFLLFDKRPRNLFLPERYRSILSATYRRGGVPLLPPSPAGITPGTIERRHNPYLDIAYLIFHAPATGDAIDAALSAAFLEGCKMVYADINLERIGSIDILVQELNSRRFFYAGVMFAFHRGEDYLRLQRKNSPSIDEEHLVCYSGFARRLLAFIREDERQVDISGQ